MVPFFWFFSPKSIVFALGKIKKALKLGLFSCVVNFILNLFFSVSSVFHMKPLKILGYTHAWPKNRPHKATRKNLTFNVKQFKNGLACRGKNA